MKMLDKGRVTHVFLVIWDVKFDGSIHFQIWPEGRSMSGQIRLNWVKFTNSSFPKTYLSYLLLPQVSKIAIYFDVWQFEMPKIVFWKMMESVLPVVVFCVFSVFFSGCATSRNKNTILKFSGNIAYTLPYNMPSG